MSTASRTMDGKRISFEVPGVPMAWKRARATVRFGHASMFEDKLQTSYKADVRSYLRKQCGKVEAYAGAVSLSLAFVFPLLKSDFKKDGTPSKSGRRKLSGEEAMAKKPDLDNLCKMVMDALNGVAWLDDSQVCLLSAEKRYGSEPKTVIELRYGGDRAKNPVSAHRTERKGE